MWKKFEFLRWFGRYLWLMTVAIGTFFFVILVLRLFVLSPGRVNGPSMEPNYKDEDLFFVNKLVFLVTLPQRFDVVQVVDPLAGKLYIKRIIGLPGETVVIKRGKVFLVNTDTEENVKEDYLSKQVYTRVPFQQAPKEFVIPQNNYFVMGDNRAHSTDSREWGAISRTNIVGRIISFKTNK